MGSNECAVTPSYILIMECGVNSLLVCGVYTRSYKINSNMFIPIYDDIRLILTFVRRSCYWSE